jgi:PAS domain S-box-containing protein
MTAIFARRNLRSLLRTALIVAAYLCAFIILDLISRQFEELRGIVAWYPPAGLTYALLLVFGARFTPAVTIASLIGSVFIYHMPQPAHLLFLWALITSSIYGVAAAFLRHRIRFDWQLRKLRDVTWLVVTAVFVSALLAVLSVLSSALSSDMPRNEVLRAIFIWWIGETVGVLTITPFLLIHVMPRLKRSAEGRPVRSPARRSFPRPTLSVIGQAFSIAFMFYWVFGARGLGEFRPMYLITLPLIWIALDYGFKGVTTGIVVLNFGVMLAMWFFRFDLAPLGELQLLMIVNCIVGLLMGAVVTERKRAENALRESEERYRTLIQNVGEGIGFVDPEEQFAFANAAAEDIFGVPPGGLLGRSLREFTSPEQFGMIRQQSDRRQAGEKSVYEIEISRPKGEKRNLLITAVPQFDGQGKTLGTFGVFRDITDRVHAEADKEAMQGQLRQSQKMEAIGTLAGGVAHDFNNLLTGILGNIALMRSSLPPTDPLLENLNGAETAARQAADLTKGLLTFGRSAMVLPVPMKIAAALEASLKLLKQSLPATMEIVRDDDQEAWTVLLDQSQMTQILLNLAVNARDAMVGKGMLTIRTRNEVVREEYVQNHPFARAGEYVHLSIRDTGPGIPPAILEHLFEPFHTTKPSGSGTGLGLSIVYGAVKQAGGWITAVSTEGVGTTFDIYLPRCLEEPMQSFTPSPLSANVCSGTVLVVEDEPVVCEVTQALLSRSGYTVLTATDGASALNVLRDQPQGIGLILLDMTMPGMTTDEIVKAIRVLDPTVPILLNSGYTSNGAVKQMLDEGSVQDFVGKPYDLPSLMEVVQRLIRRG